MTSISANYTIFLWLLKLGVVPNLYFLASTATTGADIHLVVPAQIFFAVSAYRCLFPVHYEHYIVLHESVWSSVFVTRLLATFAEVAYAFLLAWVLHALNLEGVVWVNAAAALMVMQIVVCQAFVWIAIVTERFWFYFYEEFGWLLMYAANTIVSAYLYLTVDTFTGREILLEISLIFGVPYLPFQIINVWKVWEQAKRQGDPGTPWTFDGFATGVRRSIEMKNRRTDAAAWGGIVGLIWMTGYWAMLLPLWVYVIVQVLADGPHSGPYG